MANPERGEVALTVGDRSFTLVLDLNAICELEDFLSTPDRPVTIGQVFLMAARESYRHIRALVWASLRRHHSDMSITDAGDLIEAAGGVTKFFETLGKLRKATQQEGDSRPRKARQKTTPGAHGSSMPNASA